LTVRLHRGPHQISKGPQENNGKLGDHNNFLSEPPKIHCLQEYFKYKIESEVPLSAATPAARKAKLHFAAFPTSSLAESGFSCVNYFWSQARSGLDGVKRNVLRLSLNTLPPDIQKFASIHQTQRTQCL